MSKALIKHLWTQNREQILLNAVRNCHAVGLNSIVLLNEPGRLIRLFVAHEGHTLHHNLDPQQNPSINGGAKTAMSIAYHPHHCDIILEVVRGWIVNRWLDHAVTDPKIPRNLTTWRYRSHLRGEKPGFEKLGPVYGRAEGHWRMLHVRDTLELKASDVHTVGAAANYCPAWLVYEGAEDLDYDPLCYSNADLSTWTGDGMYIKMSPAEIEADIEPLIQL